VRRILPALLCLALATGLASFSRAADEETVPLRITKGDELTPDEDKAVRATLLRYLEAVQKLDWRGAAKYVDRETFLQAVEPMVAQVSPDPAERNATRRMIFGVSTFDSLARRPLPELFAGMMTYAMSADPTGMALMEKAKISLLGARKIKGRVHVAYQLTVPAPGDSTQFSTHVTAERLKKIGDEWKILIAQDAGGGRAKP
jgi:hypothetical protein